MGNEIKLSHDADREVLENNLLDAEIHLADIRGEVQRLLPDLRDARRMVRVAKARLVRHDFVASVASRVGPEAAAVVNDQVQHV